MKQDSSHLYLAAVAFCFFALMMDGWLAWSLVRQWRASSYPSTTGTVTLSAAVYSGGHSGGWWADIHYEYVVAGERYEADQMRYDSVNGNEDAVKMRVIRYPPQRTVTVYYNPVAPADAVLELGFDWEVLAGVGLLLSPLNAAAVAFSCFALKGTQSRWPGRPIAGAAVRNNGRQTRIRFYEQSPALVAVIAWGGVGVVSIIVAAILMLFMPGPFALAVAWSVTIAGTAVAWWRARDRYSELRRDKTSGTVEIRRRDGTHEVSLNSGLEAFCPNRRPSKTGEVQRFPLHLRFRDTDERRRSFKLPTAATPEEAARIANWLNELLGLPRKS